MEPSQENRSVIAREILAGLAVGDALGEALSYNHHRARELSDFSVFRANSVRYTDDTAMATALYKDLICHRSIDSHSLARSFALEYLRDSDRGYGKMARRILSQIGSGENWHRVSSKAFGTGSFGNGAAMRVAPLGGYFHETPDAIPEKAEASAIVTHFHPEGIAGAIAVAVAAGAAARNRDKTEVDAAGEIMRAVLQDTPESEVRRRIESVLKHTDSADAARAVGNGVEISAQDTVPFCIWNACRCVGDFREAFLSTVEVGGDCDTNAAIVCGIVTGYVGLAGVPGEWMRITESPFSNEAIS